MPGREIECKEKKGAGAKDLLVDAEKKNTKTLSDKNLVFLKYLDIKFTSKTNRSNLLYNSRRGYLFFL